MIYKQSNIQIENTKDKNENLQVKKKGVEMKNVSKIINYFC